MEAGYRDGEREGERERGEGEGEGEGERQNLMAEGNAAGGRKISLWV